MPEPDSVHSFAALRIEELAEEESQLRTRLGRYRRFSKIAVLFGIVIPVFAGSSLISSSDISGIWRIVVAILVFIAAALTAFHKGLDCEAYQADCRHAIHALRSLEEGYEALGTLEGEPLRKAFEALETRLQHYRERAFDLPASPRAKVAG